MTRGSYVKTHWRQINLPKAHRLILILDGHVQTDVPTDIIQVESEKGAVGIRVSGVTGGKPWRVDLYGGCCYIALVEGFHPERVNTPLRVVNYLKSKLPPPFQEPL